MTEQTQKKEVLVPKEEIVKHIARELKFYQSNVRDVWEATEEYVYTMIANMPDDEKLIIKLFNGISIEAEIEPAKEKYIHYKGKTYEVAEHVKMKVKFSRYIKEKVNNVRELALYEFKEEKDNGTGSEHRKNENDSYRSIKCAETDGQEN